MVETVVALPEALHVPLGRRAPYPHERYQLGADALRGCMAHSLPGDDSPGLAFINANANRPNAEAEDARSYQVPV